MHSITLVPWFPGFRRFSLREGCSEPDLSMRTDSGMASWSPTPCECLRRVSCRASYRERGRALYCRASSSQPLGACSVGPREMVVLGTEGSGWQHVAQPRDFTPNLSTARLECLLKAEADSKPQYGTPLQGF